MEHAERKFNRFVKRAITDVENSNLSEEERHTRKINIQKKVNHTQEVVADGMKIVKHFKFSQSIGRYIKLVLLDHDIGRFPQVAVFGNYNDNLVAKARLFTGKDHCEWGSYILRDCLLKSQIPNTRTLDYSISRIVQYHGTGKLPNDLNQNMIACELLQNETVSTICNGSNEYLK